MAISKKHLAKKQLHAGVQRDAIVSFLNKELRIAEIKDSSCNGLQVQGAESVTRAAFTVDACMEAYERAAEAKCELLVVHHGLIWGGLTSITGPSYQHVKFLLDHGINLYAAHLPLDLHPVLGNNAELARILGLQAIKPFGNYHGIDIGFEGILRRAFDIGELCDLLGEQISASCTALNFSTKPVKRVAVVSGGAAGELGEAIQKGIDCYITGEPAHSNYHAAKEAGVNVIYCGHYESETVGVKALMPVLQKRFGIYTEFIDIPTSI